MFDDRTQSLNSVQNMGRDILATQPDGDSAAKTRKDLDRVTELWNLLNSSVEERKNKLDSLLPISQSVIAKFDDARKRLNNIDKTLDNEKWIPLASEDGVRQQIEGMKVSSMLFNFLY